MPADRYPGATWKGDGRSGGSFIDVPYRLVLHTTETEGLPGYAAGLTAPHITYDPRRREWTQHTEFDRAARALRNMTGGVETNRARALQVEIICYSAKHIADDQPLERTWVGDLDDLAYADLNEFIRWAGVEFGVQRIWPGRQAFNYDQANEPGFRFNGTDWYGFGGVCGHQHVTENTHWDPGAIDWSKLMDGPNGEPNWDEVSDWAKPAWTAAHEAGLLTENSHPRDVVEVEQMMSYFKRAGIT